MDITRPLSRFTEEDRLSRMERTLDDTNTIVKDLQGKFTTYAAKPASVKPKKTQEFRFCQSLVRKVTQALINDAEDPLELEYDSFDDRKVQRGRDRVVREIMLTHSGKPWAKTETLNEAFKQVWKNRRDDYHRQLSGKKENHRIGNRRNKRRISKLQDRVKALGKTKKSEEWRSRAKEILTRECTSSDVSDDEDVKVKLVLPLVWESTLMTDIKEQLDCIRGKDLRQDHPSKMLRDYPSSRVPEWAIRGRYKEQRRGTIHLSASSPDSDSSAPSTPSSSRSAESSTLSSTPSESSFLPSSPSTPSTSTPSSRISSDSPVQKSKKRRSF